MKEVCQSKDTVQQNMWGFTVHDTKFEQISHLETCVGYIPFYVIPQFPAFCHTTNHCFHLRITIHYILCPRSKQKSNRCWGLLRTNCNEKTVVLSSLQHQIFNKFICKWLINPFSNRSYHPGICGCCTVTHRSWCRRNEKITSMHVV